MADSIHGRRNERLPEPACGSGQRKLPRVVPFAVLLGFAACGGGGTAGTIGGVQQTTQPELLAVEYGRLVDVFGLRATAQGSVIDLYRQDVLIGPDIQDERAAGQSIPDGQILYDFVGSNPDTLQPRLFIPREIGSEAFNEAFDALDARVNSVIPQVSGGVGAGQQFTVVPRNGAFRLTFSRDLGVTDDFFVTRDSSGQVTGIRNGEAAQLIEISGDPQDPASLVPLSTRVLVDGNKMVLDPVLLGSEGLQYQTRNNASGLPASANNTGANIRIALALEGPLAIPSMRGDAAGRLVGINNVGRRSIVRDFRSGNSSDDTPEIARGFVRDPEPPRLVGEILMYVERVTPVNQFTNLVRLYKNGIRHEIDRGDVLRFIVDNSGVPVATAEVISDPEADRGQPDVQHVDVRVRFAPGVLELDPTSNPTYPVGASGSQLEEWLVGNAAKAVLVCEYQGGQFDTSVTPPEVLLEPDDPRLFLTFTPSPLPFADGTPSLPNENVSPFAGAVLRFTKPVARDSAKPADTLFFATRNVLDTAAQQEFVASRPWQRLNNAGQVVEEGIGMDPGSFNADKFRTPHLVGSRIIDEDGSQTSLRLQPLLGFYLDDAMRSDGNLPYYLHLVGGANGIVDLAGNPIDLQSNEVDRANGMVIPFTLDVRTTGPRPNFENNLAVSVVRRHEDSDEDPQPSYYLPSEVQGRTDIGSNARAYALPDLYGAFVVVNGVLQGRATTRVRRIADNLNQAPIASQESILRWCPQSVFNEEQTASASATTPFGQGIQNPMNPYGCRLQTVWREVDLSLSRVDPFDFNLDVEQMYWAPFTGDGIGFDEFDSMSLYLGHSEYRPEPCVGNFSALASLADSGLKTRFEDNFVRNLRANVNNTVESRPQPYSAYAETPSPLRIDSAMVVREPNGINRYLPLPQFRRPYFVYRDERVVEQGCRAGSGSDSVNSSTGWNPYIISPWNHGLGRRAVQVDSGIEFVNGFWNNGNNHNLRNSGQADLYTDGMVGNIALPLLADFWTQCDSPDLPAGNGYIAFGTNGWQISLTLTSGAQPNFRVLSAGHPQFPNAPALCLTPSSGDWEIARGGYQPPPPFGTGGRTASGDNSLYWIMIDFLKRASVITNGFVDLYNPHRVPLGFADSRLGPFFQNPVTGNIQLPPGILPNFSFEIDPPLTALPGGTSILPQFRAASEVDSVPWYWDEWVEQRGNQFYPSAVDDQLKPDEVNFPLDPFKACDAHIRKFDDRAVFGAASRSYWAYLYNRNVTGYVEDPNQLFDAQYLSQYQGPNEGFVPQDVRYVNWRYLMSNNVDATPPIAPGIDTFVLSYRFERAQ
jgi:hypothetical protein